MRLVTWNVWFAPTAFHRRAKALIAQLKALDADVIALQEVTQELLPYLYELDGYDASDRSHHSVDPYGTWMASRIGGRFVWHDLPTWQGRRLLVLETDDVDVATVHLESRRISADTRMEQLDVIFPLLRQRAVLMGDFNFDADWPEQAHIPSDFTDAWVARRGLADGYTCDTTVNGMLAADKGKDKHVRYDRIVTRGFEVDAIELLGTEPIGADAWVSDHFGLFAELTAR